MSLRLRMIIIELLIHFCWFPITFATNPTVSTNVQIEKEKENEVVEEIQTEPTWEERAIEVLEQILNETIKTPPRGAAKTSRQNRPGTDLYWNMHLDRQKQAAKQKVFHLSGHVNLARICAQNILTQIKERNDTASKSLWERSGKSAGEARGLAEESASFTKDVVENLSEEKAVSTIASHITAQIGKLLSFIIH